MLSEYSTQFLNIMHEGGPLMWVLLGMSIVSVALMVERTWFWVRLNSASHLARVANGATDPPGRPGRRPRPGRG